MLAGRAPDTGGGRDLQEVEAEAFAVDFLLPEWLIAAEMRRYVWTQAAMAQAENVYQLSLRAGISFEATTYVLGKAQGYHRRPPRETASRAAKILKAIVSS